MPTNTKKPQPPQPTQEELEQARRAVQMSMDTRQ